MMSPKHGVLQGISFPIRILVLSTVSSGSAVSFPYRTISSPKAGRHRSARSRQLQLLTPQGPFRPFPHFSPFTLRRSRPAKRLSLSFHPSLPTEPTMLASRIFLFLCKKRSQDSNRVCDFETVERESVRCPMHVAMWPQSYH